MNELDENNPLILQCKARVQQFFIDFDNSPFEEKIKIIIEFIESNFDAVENAKRILGENTEEFRFYSDSIFMMPAAKFTELLELCKSDSQKRNKIFEPVSDQSYGATMWDQYTYIMVRNYPSGPVKGWPFNQDARISWTMPLLEFGNLKTQKSTPKTEGCYIATMAYGDYNHPQVLKLRYFRDDYLSKTLLGRSFIKFYYFISPKMVQVFQNKKGLNHFIRKSLDVFIKIISK
jgi:hypothetical protein